jgi:DNA-binding LacI/PurR family transcriptional regulator
VSITDGDRGAATIYDVAQLAGVSISTVSLALNQPARVAAATRERVLTAVDDLGFTPKATAVQRARKALQRVGVLAPFSSYASFTERLSGVLEIARTQGLEVVLFDAESAADSVHPLVSTLPITQRLDGMILMSLPLAEQAAERLRRSGLPTVLLDSSRVDLTSIDTDDEGGGHLAGIRLIESGKRRLVFVTERKLSDSFVSQADRRLAGLRRAATEAGLDPAGVQVIEGSSDFASGQAAMVEVLRDLTPVGVFGHHDLLAAGALQAARAAGRSIPDEVAVVGFDDGDVATSVGLTTIRQPLRQSGSIAMSTLLDLLTDPTTPLRRITLGVELVVRESA